MENDKQQNFSSSFVGRTGLIIIFVAVLASNYFGYAALSSFLIFIWLVCLVSNRWGKIALKNVRVSIEADKLYIFQGNHVKISYNIDNNKLLPLIWLEIIQKKPKSLESDESLSVVTYKDEETLEEYTAFIRKFAWVMWHQKISTSAVFTAVKRGIYNFRDVKLVSGDGFGLSISNKNYILEDPLSITVYPKLVEVHTEVFMRNVFDNSAGARGVYDDVTLLKNNRAYIYGDNAKKINWRMLAKKNEMQVNIYETIMPKTTFFIVDIESYKNINEDDTEFENMLSVLSSVIIKLDEAEMKCGIAIPKTMYQEENIVLPFIGDQKLNILEAISGIEYNGGKTLFNNSEILKEKEYLGQIYVFCSSFKNCSCRELIGSLEESATTIIVNSMDNGAGIYGNKIVEINTIWEGKNNEF